MSQNITSVSGKKIGILGEIRSLINPDVVYDHVTSSPLDRKSECACARSEQLFTRTLQ